MSWRAGGVISAIMVFTFFAFVFFPNFVGRDRKYQTKTACIANLKTIEGAKATWETEFEKQTNAIPTGADLFGPNKYIYEKPVCPAGGIYTLGKVGEKPRCSIPGHTL